MRAYFIAIVGHSDLRDFSGVYVGRRGLVVPIKVITHGVYRDRRAFSDFCRLARI